MTERKTNRKLIERVARAIYQAGKPTHHADWKDFVRIEGNRDALHRVAIAAIEAMQERQDE
jgi:hypothetical protein